MFRLRFDRQIERPVELVFTRLADVDGYGDWLPRSLIFKGGGLAEHDRRIDVGTKFVDRTPFGRFHGEVTEFEPPHRIAFESQLRWWGRLVFESKPSYILEPAGHGTHVRHEAEGATHGIFRIGEPLVRKLATNERRRTIDELKRSLEAGPE